MVRQEKDAKRTSRRIQYIKQLTAPTTGHASQQSPKGM